ncbi:RidA family protein [Nonomuraea sp. NPDC026600]|uniref:RidA family protein n=1 Tax=Nonomuraea sp. NPDC026600 TaxID=3155363 RepID=UPI0033FA55E6
MAVSLINPDRHVQVPIYHHVAVATGSRQVHIAGQVAWEENGELVAPGDLAGQVAQVYRNIAKALDAAGATFHDVVRFTWYAAGWKREMYDAFNAGIEQAAREFDIATPPAALIGVDILFDPDILIEAEVTAIID